MLLISNDSSDHSPVSPCADGAYQSLNAECIVVESFGVIYSNYTLYFDIN